MSAGDRTNVKNKCVSCSNSRSGGLYNMYGLGKRKCIVDRCKNEKYLGYVTYFYYKIEKCLRTFTDDYCHKDQQKL